MGERVDTKRMTARARRFCELYVQHGNATRAHEEAGYVPNGSYETHKNHASRKLRRPAFKAYIAELQSENAKANRVTVEQLLGKLNIAYQLAGKERRPAAMVSAVMGMARITGLDKQIIEHHTGNIQLVINRPHGA